MSRADLRARLDAALDAMTAPELAFVLAAVATLRPDLAARPEQVPPTPGRRQWREPTEAA